MNKTTKKDFVLYKAESQKWIALFGLNNWDVNFYHTDDEGSCLAWTAFNFEGKLVDSHLNKKWPERMKPTPYEIRKTAFHEVCEVLLFPIRYLGECRFLTNSEMEPEVHNVINVLENTVFDKMP